MPISTSSRSASEEASSSQPTSADVSARTDVISELRRPDKADRNVVTWAGAISAASFFLSAISFLEIELGALLSARRDAAQGAGLRAGIDAQILPRSAARLLPVATAVAPRGAGVL